jgi:hypothetical protein
MKTSDIDLNLATLDGPKPSFDTVLEEGQTNRFAYMKLGAHNLVLDLTVTADSEVVDSQYGKYVWVTPDTEDLPTLLAIESFLDNPVQSSKLLGMEELPYAMKKLLGSNYNYRLKLRGAMANVTVEHGSKLNIVCTPGFYFNEQDASYGCFLSSVKPGKPVKKFVKRK